MSRKSPALVLVALLFCAALGFLFVVQLRGKTAAAQISSTAQDERSPFALVKTIVVGDEERAEAFTPNEVTIVHDGKSSGAKPGTMLYAGDEVTTGKDTRLTILFLDNAAEKDNEVLVYSDTHVQLGSIFTWAGKILARVKDNFAAKTTRAQWSVAGTEYELAVDENTGTNKLVVLKGEVKVRTGTFAPTVAENSEEQAAPPDPPDDGSMFLRASFREPEPLPQRQRMEFVAIHGKVINIEREFILTNSCKRSHHYRIASPLNLNWFQFLGGEQFQIAGGQTRTINFAIQLDATNVPVGDQQSQIVFPCIDCDAEPGCGIGGLFLPITVKVIGRETTTPPPSPTPWPTVSPEQTETGPQSATVGRMQELTLVRTGGLRKTAASEAEVDGALNWSNEVIIPGAPSYPAQSVVPRYATAEERNRAFRERRRSSIVNNDQESKEALAAVYVDWGNGPKAEEELKRLGLRSPETAEQLVTLGEALRLEGKLSPAASLLERAVARDPSSAAALNALGNVYLDLARAEQDKGNTEQARQLLERAEIQYLKAQAAQPADRNHSQTAAVAESGRKAAAVAQSNIGEVHLRLGELARDEGKSDEALSQFQSANQAFSNATKIDSTYPFAITGVGDAYRETGETLAARGDRSAADSYFLMSKEVYFRAAKLHSDMAEAYVGVGKVLDDTGNHDEARKYYFKATQARPELPDPHYRLAVALAPVDPRRAAEQARAYLKIEREPLKQGRQANDARGIVQGIPPTPTPTPRTVTTPTPTPTPTPSPVSVSLVQMPHMLGDKPEQGLRKLSDRGLVGQIQEQADCKVSGKIIGTNKGRDEKVPSGSTVIVYVSGPGPNAVEVPTVKRLQLGQAENTLRISSLQSKIERREDDTVAEDTVLRQRPETGKLPPNCPVELTVSFKPQLFPAPNYVGLTREQAFERLPKIFGDFTRGPVTEIESNQAPGTVVAQFPAAGTMVRKGASISLTISRSPQIEVPDFQGMSEKQAKALIMSKQGLLTLGEVSFQQATCDPSVDRVIGQSPQPKQMVPVGQKINLVILKSPAICQIRRRQSHEGE